MLLAGLSVTLTACGGGGALADDQPCSRVLGLDGYELMEPYVSARGFAENRTDAMTLLSNYCHEERTVGAAFKRVKAELGA